MEYTMEEVQPLKDDDPLSTDHTDSTSFSPDEETPQPAEETDSISLSPLEDNPQPAEETDLVSFFPPEENLQPAEVTGSPSLSQQEDNTQPAEETDSPSFSLQEDNLQPADDSDLISIPPQEDYPQPAEETDSISTSPENANLQPEQQLDSNSFSPLENDLKPSEQVVSISAMPEVVSESKPRKIALILSGGGARGAFQVGAEKYARDVKGYHWDIIAGVSVGAMNGGMLAMHRYTRLMELWDNISDAQVYTGGFNLLSLLKIMFGAKSFYGNAPLLKLMQHEFEAGKVIDDLHVGAVSLISGDYVQFTKESLELSKAILASASIPVVWPPVDVSPDRTAMVDGGVRNLSPVGDVLDLEPDEIVIINCGTEQPPVLPQSPANVLSIGMRALDIMQNEIFVNDMKEFLRINALVQEAEKQGCLLHHPKTGRLLKYYPCQIIEPDGELGEVLDFSQKSVQSALKAGVRRAREVLGRP